MGAVAARFNENAGGEQAVVLSDQKFSACPEFVQTIQVNALAFDPWTLGHEGAIDKVNDWFDVGRFGGTDVECRHEGILRLPTYAERKVPRLRNPLASLADCSARDDRLFITGVSP